MFDFRVCIVENLVIFLWRYYKLNAENNPVLIQKLYTLGGRKFVLMSVNPLGCNPVARASQPMGEDDCIQVLNQAAHLFNARLRLTVDFIRPQMPGSTLVFVNSYKIIRDIIRDPVSNGKMKNTDVVRKKLIIFNFKKMC